MKIRRDESLVADDSPLRDSRYSLIQRLEPSAGGWVQVSWRAGLSPSGSSAQSCLNAIHVAAGEVAWMLAIKYKHWNTVYCSPCGRLHLIFTAGIMYIGGRH